LNSGCFSFGLFINLLVGFRNEFTALIKLTGPGGKLEKPLQKVAKLLLLLSENNSIVLYLAAVGTTNTPTMAAVYLVENYYKLTALSSHLH
jgi:hypothetical protein